MKEFDELWEVIKILRSPDGCPWDRKQTNHSLRYSLIEESYEAIDAIESDNLNALKEELGDLLLVVLMHILIQEESKGFGLKDVLISLKRKLVERHPHVFGDKKVSGVDEVLKNWEELKSKGVMIEPPPGLPSLLQIQKVQERAARLGFDWKDPSGPLKKLSEELKELQTALLKDGKEKIEEELSDLVFAWVNLVRHLGYSAEVLARKSVIKFIERFQKVEEKAKKLGRDLSTMTLEEMDKLWEETKLRDT